MEPPPPPPSSTSTEASKGKQVQLIDRDLSKASSSRISFEFDDLELNEEWIHRDLSKASSSRISFEFDDLELNEELIHRDLSKASSSRISFEFDDLELNEEFIENEPNNVLPLLGMIPLEPEFIDNEPNYDNSLFSVIEPGDPVDEALKNMVSVIKDSGQIDNEIRIITSYQQRFPNESQESLDNVLIDLYKLQVKKTEDISNSNDSPYMKANHAAKKEKNLEEAWSLYCAALEHNDRLDSVVKNLADALKRLGRTDEAISVIKDNKTLCSQQSHNSLDNLLIKIYKSDPNRTAEHINFLEEKLELVENGTTFEGKETKVVKVKKKNSMVKAKKMVISLDRQRARLLGEIAWLYMLQGNYHTAETYLRKSLSLQPFKNNQCNLAICLIKHGRISDARDLLQDVTASSNNEWEITDSFIKSYDRAWKMLAEFENGDI